MMVIPQRIDKTISSQRELSVKIAVPTKNPFNINAISDFFIIID